MFNIQLNFKIQLKFNIYKSLSLETNNEMNFMFHEVLAPYGPHGPHEQVQWSAGEANLT